ncbi:hypothetical protein WJX77_009108 [Trebouxia sp. C0004]
MVRAAWVTVVMIALLGICDTDRLKGCWDSRWLVETAVLILPVGFLAFLLVMFVLAMWRTLLKLLIGPTSRWRQQNRSFLALLKFAVVVFHAHHRPSELSSIHGQGVILPSWSGRDPTLLARVQPRSTLTSWVGPEALPDFLAGSIRPLAMPFPSGDLHAHQPTATALTVSSGLLEVAPALSASTLGRFQPRGLLGSHFGRGCQACCKPHEPQQQLPQLGWSFDLHFQVLALPSSHTLAPVKNVFLSCPSDQMRGYLASHSLSVQQLLLRQAEYAYAINVFRFAGLDMSIRQALAVYGAQCPSVWREQRTSSLVQLFQGFFMSPLHSTRASPQQQLPGMSGLVLNSMSSSSSAWVWCQTTRLATSVGRASAESMALICCNTSAITLGSSASMTVQQEPRHQYNGISTGSTSAAQGSTRPAFTHRPDVHVSNVIFNISTCVMATWKPTQGLQMNVQQEPRHQHNGRPTGSTSWDNTINKVSWFLTLTSSDFSLDTNVAALCTVELCMIEGIYINVQGLICHTHSGTSRTILGSSPLNTTIVNGMSLSNGNQKTMPNAINTLAAVDGMHDISKDCAHLWMQVVLNTTAMALHPERLQPQPLPPKAMHHLEEDDTPSFWVVALLTSFTVHITLVVIQKSGCFSCLLGVVLSAQEAETKSKAHVVANSGAAAAAVPGLDEYTPPLRFGRDPAALQARPHPPSPRGRVPTVGHGLYPDPRTGEWKVKHRLPVVWCPCCTCLMRPDLARRLNAASVQRWPVVYSRTAQ